MFDGRLLDHIFQRKDFTQHKSHPTFLNLLSNTVYNRQDIAELRKQGIEFGAAKTDKKFT